MYLIYKYEVYLALNNLQGLICHKTKSYLFDKYVVRGFGIKYPTRIDMM